MLPPGLARHWVLISTFIMAGATLGLLWRRLSRDNDSTAAEWKWDMPVLVVSTSGIGWIIMWCGMRQFGGFDHSALIDPAWRIVCGQRPGVDFPARCPRFLPRRGMGLRVVRGEVALIGDRRRVIRDGNLRLALCTAWAVVRAEARCTASRILCASLDNGAGKLLVVQPGHNGYGSGIFSICRGLAACACVSMGCGLLRRCSLSAGCDEAKYRRIAHCRRHGGNVQFKTAPLEGALDLRRGGSGIPADPWHLRPSAGWNPERLCRHCKPWIFFASVSSGSGAIGKGAFAACARSHACADCSLSLQV